MVDRPRKSKLAEDRVAASLAGEYDLGQSQGKGNDVYSRNLVPGGCKLRVRSRAG